MKKALLLGDYTAASYHPLKGVDAALVKTLDGFAVTISEDYPDMDLAELNKFDLVVSYIDAWAKRGGAFAGELMAYVALGGALLTLHNGLISRALPEIHQMVGAAFTGHPAHETINYIFKGDHELSKGAKAFSLDEEPYQFQLDNLANLDIFLEYEYKGETYPAAWTRNFGQGKSCYVSIGHNGASFENADCAEFILRCALWCAGRK